MRASKSVVRAISSAEVRGQRLRDDAWEAGLELSARVLFRACDGRPQTRRWRAVCSAAFVLLHVVEPGRPIVDAPVFNSQVPNEDAERPVLHELLRRVRAGALNPVVCADTTMRAVVRTALRIAEEAVDKRGVWFGCEPVDAIVREHARMLGDLSVWDLGLTRKARMRLARIEGVTAHHRHNGLGDGDW